MTVTEALHNDGDTATLPDGRVLRLRIEPDPSHSINDYDSDGKIEWARHDAPRPDGFDGAAVVIETDYPYRLWWQPWEGATQEEAAQDVHRISDLVRFGFVGIGLELLERCDHDALHEVSAAWVWGVEWDVSPEYLQHLLADHLAELGIEASS